MTSTPHSPPPPTHWKRVKKLDFAQNPRSRWKDEERKGERWGTDDWPKWGAVHTNRGRYVAQFKFHRVDGALGSTTWAATLIGPDKTGPPFILFLEMTEPCNEMESVSECDQWQWPIWTASRAMWDSNTPQQGLQVRVGEPADWK